VFDKNYAKIRKNNDFYSKQNEGLLEVEEKRKKIEENQKFSIITNLPEK
jgi:hypothetical protein